jgi:hypothetical protein
MLLAQGLTQERSQLVLPRPDGFMGKDKAPLEKHLGEVPQAQLIPDTPQDDQTNHIRGILQAVKGRPRSLVNSR